MDAPPSDNLWIGSLPPALDKTGLLALFAPYGTVTDCRVLPSKQEGAKASAMVRFSSVEEATWLVENLNGNMPEGLDEPIVVRFANPPGSAGSWKGGGKDWRASPYGEKGGGKFGGGFENWGGGDAWGSFDGGKGSFDGGKGKDGGKDGKGKGASRPGSFKALLRAVSDKFGAMRAPLENQVYVGSLPLDTTDLDLYKLFSPFGAVAPDGVRAMCHADGTCKGFGFVDFVETSSADLAVSQMDGFECPDGSTIHCSKKTAGKSQGKGKWGDGGMMQNGADGETADGTELFSMAAS